MVKLSYLARKILIEYSDPSTGSLETILLGFNDTETVSEHLSRYIFASKLVQGIVLDCASGSCYGSSILKRNNAVKLVISVDINRDLLRYGKIAYNADCVCADVAYLPFKEHIFDAIVSMETLEHIKSQYEYIAGIEACLKFGGELILSTPNKLYSSPLLPKPLNPYHSSEYYLGSLITLLRSYCFRVINSYGVRKVAFLELMRRLFGSLLKFMLSRISLKPCLVDKFYSSLINRLKTLKKSVSLMDPDPRIFTCIKLQTTSNIILYQCFLIHSYKKFKPRT